MSKSCELSIALAANGLEEQFGAMTANPDVVVATPGRFLHRRLEG